MQKVPEENLATIKVYDPSHEVQGESEEAALETIKTSEVLNKDVAPPER